MYGTEVRSTTVAPYEFGSVSLPADLSSSRPAADLLHVEGRKLIEGCQKKLLRKPAEIEQLHREGGVRPYWDAKLKRNQREYRRFLARLWKLGLIRWTTEPIEFASLFFCGQEGWVAAAHRRR